MVNELRRVETRMYFILLLGYFRAHPIIFTFSFDNVKEDVDFIKEKYFSDKKMSYDDLSPTTKTKLVNKLLKHTGYLSHRNNGIKNGLLQRLNDVAKINLEPRYLFDECLSYFGQTMSHLLVIQHFRM